MGRRRKGKNLASFRTKGNYRIGGLIHSLSADKLTETDKLTENVSFLSLFFLSLLDYGFVSNKIYKLEIFHFSLLKCWSQ